MSKIRTRSGTNSDNSYTSNDVTKTELVDKEEKKLLPPLKSSHLKRNSYSSNHRRSQSILSQISINSSSNSNNNNNNSNNNNGNGNNSNELDINNDLFDLRASPILNKNKISPENSPNIISSPLKVSGISDGPSVTNLMLEMNDTFSLNSNEKKNLNNLLLNCNNDSSSNTNNTSNTSNTDNNNTDSNLFFDRIYSHYPNLNIIISSILLWYLFSMGISVYNRWMFSSENLNFKFPILITSIHQIILSILSVITLILFPNFRMHSNKYKKIPNKEISNDSNNNSNNIGNDNEEIETEENISYYMSPKEYFTKIFPCSFASAGDIGLGNTSFRFITLSLYTMVKTSSLIFVLLWGVLFKLEEFNLKILTIVIIMSFGVSTMVWGQNDNNNKKINDKIKENLKENDKSRSFIQYSYKNKDKIKESSKRFFNEIRGLKNKDNSINFVFIGISLVLISACMSGLRWALTQIMLKKNKHTKNPILTILYVSPGMCIVLFIVGSIVEGTKNFLNSEIWEIKGILLTIILILIPGFLAFFMTLAEYILLQYASLLTLSIAGIFKELLTIFISWIIFDDKLSLINIIGLVITFTDIVFYNIYRFQQNSELSKRDNFNPESLDNEFVDIELNSMIK